MRHFPVWLPSAALTITLLLSGASRAPAQAPATPGNVASPGDAAIAKAVAQRAAGNFDGAFKTIRAMLDAPTANLPAAIRRALEFELERMLRIRGDYSLNRDELLKTLREKFTSVTEAELSNLEASGRIDMLVIDGQKRYTGTTARNLALSGEDFRTRQVKPKPDKLDFKGLYRQMKQAKACQLLTSDTLVLPQDLACTYTLIVKPGAVTEGKTIRAWLPVPAALPSQTDICIYHHTPAGVSLIANPIYPHRTIYLEGAALEGKATEFEVAYTYRCYVRVANLDPAEVRPYAANSPEVAYYAAERKPHVDFSAPELQQINAVVSRGEKNPLVVAKRAYDWVARNTIYQYAREYSTIDNLSAYTAGRRAGDCGQHAMLFIALCRMNGIPARWATGWEHFSHNMHDWAEIYIEPYGWLPVDVDMAVNALHHNGGALDKAQAAELADWWFGNQDNMRLTVNTDFGRELYPAKDDFRSETVDFQRGEVEVKGGANLYFNKWGYDRTILKITPEEAQATQARLRP